MSEESVEVVRGAYEAFVCGDFERALAAYDPEVVWDGTELPDVTVARGHDAVVDHVTRWGQMWGDNWEVELQDVIDAGEDRAIAVTQERGRSKSGVEVTARYWDLYVLRNGKIIFRKSFSDADQALEEAGFR
jgi:ketosteroid isomerase-like protein